MSPIDTAQFAWSVVLYLAKLWAYLCIGATVILAVVLTLYVLAGKLEGAINWLGTRYRHWRMRRRLRGSTLELVERGDCWEGFDLARQHHPVQEARAEYREQVRAIEALARTESELAEAMAENRRVAERGRRAA